MLCYLCPQRPPVIKAAAKAGWSCNRGAGGEDDAGSAAFMIAVITKGRVVLLAQP